VRDYFRRFTGRWPDVGALAAAEDAEVMAEWAGLGYYARARNLLKCARVVASDLGGRFPDTVEGLRALPGIGPYTAAAIAAIAFDRPAAVLDGNVERVMARLHGVEVPLPAAKPALLALAAAATPALRPGDHAQAVMDLGATICTPRNPACGICPLRTPCLARAVGIAAELPRKSAKAAKPVRLGHAFVGRRTDGAWLLERKPDSGLLGGMLGWPGSGWDGSDRDGVAAAAPPLPGEWAPLGAEVRHTFTHFHLRLAVHVGALPAASEAPPGLMFVPAAAFRPAALPTVMRKVFDLAQTAAV
jgi:A/G-specific adenine glycosylase